MNSSKSGNLCYTTKFARYIFGIKEVSLRQSDTLCVFSLELNFNKQIKNQNFFPKF